MSLQIKVPTLPESVADATVLKWHKNPGDAVARDENLVDLETDKVVLEVPSPQAGVLQDIQKIEGSTVTADEILAIINAGANAQPAVTEQAAAVSAPSSAPSGPAARRSMAEQGVQASDVQGTGKNGRILKEDVVKKPAKSSAPISSTVSTHGREEQRVPMSRLRAKVAERLLEAQHNAAMLTTFNEVNMKPVMDLRQRYKSDFEKRFDVRLGFMSFFAKAAIEALKRFPSVNASIDGKDIIYHGYYDLGIAVSTERGLVVPVLRNCDQMSMAEIEGSINDYAGRARSGKLSIEEMTGGTFTITNGGVFGSLISTPIINPPQTGILGMHKIEERAVVENGEIVARPMMYVALSYDHRLIDGKESVQFLATIKHLLEDPSRFLLGV